jgi:uncharacterized protein (DUF2249 family)
MKMVCHGRYGTRFSWPRARHAATFHHIDALPVQNKLEILRNKKPLN